MAVNSAHFIMGTDQELPYYLYFSNKLEFLYTCKEL